MTVESLLVPAIKGLSAKMRVNGVNATLALPLLHGQIDLVPARIAHNGVDLRAESKLKNPIKDIAGARHPRRATLRWLLGIDNIANRFVGCVGAHIEKHEIFFL